MSLSLARIGVGTCNNTTDYQLTSKPKNISYKIRWNRKEKGKEVNKESKGRGRNIFPGMQAVGRTDEKNNSVLQARSRRDEKHGEENHRTNQREN